MTRSPLAVVALMLLASLQALSASGHFPKTSRLPEISQGSGPAVLWTSMIMAMQARGLSGQDVANALAAQNLITPVGTQKIGNFEYSIQLNNAPSEIAALGALPIKAVNGAMVYVRDVAQVRDGNPPQTNIVHVEGNRSVLMQVLKNGSVSTLAIISGIKEKLEQIKPTLPPALDVAQIGDQSVFVRGAVNGVIIEGIIAAALTSIMPVSP